MKFSIVTISFNQERFLEKAICSVIEQDYPEVEYIVVDPGSTDGSRATIEKYRRRIQSIIFEPDSGPADGLNKGFARATGDIYGYLNSDDYFLPGALRQVATGFRQSSTDVVVGHSIIVDEKDRVRRLHYSDHFNLCAYAYGHSQVMQASTFFTRSIFDSVGGFNSRNRCSWDGELLVEFGLRKARLYMLDRFLSAFRVHEESITGSGRLKEQLQSDTERLFFRIMGRERLASDDYREAWWRIRKHLLNPRNAFERLLRGPIGAGLKRPSSAS